MFAEKAHPSPSLTPRSDRSPQAKRRCARAWISILVEGLVVVALAGHAGCGNGMPGLFNGPPTARLTATPTTGVRAGGAVTVDATASTDPDNDALTFEWRQTGGPPGGSFDAQGSATAVFTAPPVLDPTEVKVAVVVRDGRGGESTAEVTLAMEPAAEFAGAPQSLSTYRDKLSYEEAYHLLRRTSLGARPEDVQAVVDNGLNATITDLLTMKPVPTEVDALAAEYEDDMPRRWLVYLMEGPNPLLERMTMFWHDRFATSRRVLTDRDRNLAVVHWDMLRANALSNYRTFLENLTLDPLMLIWLNGENSPKTKPNENYAREFWELFTLGRDVLYSEADIREAARAFTGVFLFREDDLDARPIFDLSRHDETPKSIFTSRTTGALNYDYKSVIQVTLAQPEAARYVARNLFVFFVHDHPTDAAVQDLADAFVASNFEIAPLVKKVLTSQAMFSPEALGNQIASPVEHVVGVARTLDMHMTSEDSQGFILDRLVTDLAGGGQELLNPPGVQGWGEDQAWLEDQWVISRARALSRTMEYGPNRQTSLPYHLLPPDTNWTTAGIQTSIVDRVASVFHLTLTDEERTLYVSVLDQAGRRKFNLSDANTRKTLVMELIKLMAMDDRVIVR